jgi:hypothetical protein
VQQLWQTKKCCRFITASGNIFPENSRDDFWGTGAIKTISENLQQEMPGLRGFSLSNIKNMRIFYEKWSEFYQNRQLPTGDLTEMQIFRTGFTHHCEILVKQSRKQKSKF